jgi:hypothetical protein
MLQLTIENKELKKRMMEWTKLLKEWNDANHSYQKALIKYKHKVEGLEREREL